MQTAVHVIDPTNPDTDLVAHAAEVLRRGGIVAFPTETVYGLGANALDPEAVRRIFEAKGRPATNPVIVHVNSQAEAQPLVSEWPPRATELAERFWPGPLTLVLPRSPRIPDIVTAGGETVAVRVPSHPVARALIAASGLPLAAPSANRSARVSATMAEHVLRTLDGRIDMVLDGGPAAGGLESTVLNVSVEPPELLRPGLVSLDQLEAAIGAPVRVASRGEEGSRPLPSPGMLSRHYAPRAPLECSDRGTMAIVEQYAREGLRVGYLTLGETERSANANVLLCHMPADPAEYASRLFATLYMLDEADVDRIVVQLPPDTSTWLAVRDRLRRASVPA